MSSSWLPRARWDGGSGTAEPRPWWPAFRLPLLIVLCILGAAGQARAETWVLLRSGAFALDPQTLARIQSSLHAAVTSAAATQARQLPDWSGYTLQYQPQLVMGVRIVVIRGACTVPAGVDLSKDFYDVPGGGECYFAVAYEVGSGSFSNVAFNGDH
jgi:hypothetical protein